MSNQIVALLVALAFTAGCGGSSGDDLFGGKALDRSASGGGAVQLGAGGGVSGGGLHPSTNGGAFAGTGGHTAAGGDGDVGGTNQSGPDSGPSSCLEGAQQDCQCPTGPGVSTCVRGAYGQCACGVCRNGTQHDCTCLDNASTGTANCIDGRYGACLGCPTGPNGCPVGMQCTVQGNSGTPVCSGANGLPPGCSTVADCAALGVGCFALGGLGGICIKPCTP